MEKRSLYAIAAALLAVVCCTFSYGGQTVPAAGWLFPVLLLFATRSAGRRSGMIIALLCMIAGVNLAYAGALALLGNIPMQMAACTLFGILMAIPFVLDRYLYDGFTDTQRLLFLPFMMAFLEVIQTLTPMGDINSLAYSQMGFLEAEQMVSVIGSTGLTFMICLFGTSVNMLIVKYGEDRRIDRKAAVCIAVVAIAVLAGGIRLAAEDVSDERITVLCTEGPGVYLEPGIVDIPYEDNVKFLDEAVEEASRAGVTMLVTSEDAFRMDSSKVEEFRSHAEEKAAEYGLYIMYGLGVNDNHEQIWNTCTFINPSGVTEWVYNKTHIIPFFESCKYAGDGTTYHSDTEFGCVTAVICMDLEFPGFVSTIYDGSDILFAPSYDWNGLEVWHTRNNSLRAIENGVSFLRNTAVGTIGSYDHLGHEIMQFTYDGSGKDHYIVEVPTDSCGTIFGSYGTIILWLYVIGLFVTLVPSLLRLKSLYKSSP